MPIFLKLAPTCCSCVPNLEPGFAMLECASKNPKCMMPSIPSEGRSKNCFDLLNCIVSYTQCAFNCGLSSLACPRFSLCSQEKGMHQFHNLNIPFVLGQINWRLAQPVLLIDTSTSFQQR